MSRGVRGKVFLVGAGPGDPGLLTVRGKELLETCDTVVYDALVNPDILQFAPYFSDRIFVGKRCGRISWKQDEINALLVERARLGERVVRLKGGDPFLFGRGGEEAEFLAAAGIAWDVVPGVSSALAAPAAAGIPVTHRGLSASMAIVTAHGADQTSGVKWEALSTAVDTLVVLMGANRFDDVSARMIAAGRSPSTPAAVVQWGTYPHQRVVRGPLSEIAALAKAAGLGSPAILVVGEVAALGEQLYDALSSISESGRIDGGGDWGRVVPGTERPGPKRGSPDAEPPSGWSDYPPRFRN
jgi:uroporphyrin-III C-methyltransferase